MRKNKQTNKLRKSISNIITLVCFAVFIYSIYKLGGIALGYYHNQQVLEAVQQIYEMTDKEETIEDKSEVRSQFDQLHDINSEIVGWISIEDTKINYPVLQANNNDYYLNRNYKDEEARAGSIFMDYRNDLLADNPNIIVYGHRMKDDTMFNQLTRYLNEEFYREHSTVYFDTLYESYDAEIFSVYYTTTEFNYIQTDFASKEDYGELLWEIKKKSFFPSEVSVSPDDQIITLSTCDYTLDPKHGRLVVHAKLIKKTG